MGKRIIICSDGTGNSFKQRRSNVGKLVQFVDLGEATNQVVVYDQGIGTEASRGKEIDDFQSGLTNQDALIVLRDPLEEDTGSRNRLNDLRGQAFGYGLAENVCQMYQQLGKLYDEDDSVYLFGFSRGAFTVRALAGLVYRCGIPEKECADRIELFERAWKWYQPMKWPKCETKPEGQRTCKVDFLGIWDTVKSYGGLCPILLPHLRHNPIVKTVRHALALDEKRGWFDATTWGRLDIDKSDDGAWARLSKDECTAIEEQCIEEVWFRGCHSDIGGGDEEEETARIAFYWMLGEAVSAEVKLHLDKPLPVQPQERGGNIRIHDSYCAGWRAVDVIPRTIIDNEAKWPTTRWPRIGSAPRHPEKVLRNGRITYHESVGLEETPTVHVVSTKPIKQ